MSFLSQAHWTDEHNLGNEDYDQAMDGPRYRLSKPRNGKHYHRSFEQMGYGEVSVIGQTEKAWRLLCPRGEFWLPKTLVWRPFKADLNPTYKDPSKWVIWYRFQAEFKSLNNGK